ncbi:MAG: acyltransferase family protein [Ilumatobacteraceae bacterium]
MPYLPGLDGMRALAVAAVIVYHANSSWLPGGFLGVEVFFVISGYLITLLLIGEHESTGRINLRQFWYRRARRLLPALFLLLIGVTLWTALFRREALGQLRGDVLAALTYTSNWYQIWVGQGYTSSGDFAPLRHLWSLAVEEQFYLVWPLVMVGLIRLGRRRLPAMSRWLVLAAVVVTVLMALLYYPGPIESCRATPDAYYTIAGRCLSKTDTLYLGTFFRSAGLLLGAAFAMVWRPVALMRGPMRNKGRLLDVAAVLGLAGLAALCWYLHIVTVDGADPWLFRGGFFVTAVATLFVIAAVTHQRSLAGPLLGNAALLWIGTRSYGLYLFHWPIFQMIRRVSGNPMSLPQFVVGLAITVVITEASYRLLEMPIRKAHVKRWWRRLQSARDPAPRRVIATIGAGLVALSVFAVANLATAELRQNEIARSLAENEGEDPLTGLVAGGTGTATTDAAASDDTGSVEDSAANGADTTGSAVLAPVPTTVPPTTAAPTTTLPPPPPPITAIGDSVMLGATDELEAKGILVSAEVSRQMKTMIPVVQGLRDSGQLSDTMIIHLGTNGDLSDETINEFFTALSGVPKVLVLTIDADRSWVPANNAKLLALPAQFPNVQLLYWDGLGPTCPGDCFYDDGIHLTQAGQDYYAALIFSVLGIE